MPPSFVPGLELARGYFTEVVRPLLAAGFPRLRYAAALLGWGSEVLGYDSARSTDHNWGPRLQVFLTERGEVGTAGVEAMLAARLPTAFQGFPTAFPRTTEPGAPARHWVEVTGLRPWLTGQLGFDPTGPVTALDWLATPAQRLAEVTAGDVFHDPAGDLGRARGALAWYPRDLWLHVLACQWERVAEEEAFPGRCAEAGDELGSAVVTARLARDLMRLCLLMHRRYPPYSKWLGTAFARLPAAGPLVGPLTGAVTAAGWSEREQALGRAYRAVAVMHNDLGLTPPLDPATRLYFTRPFQVIGAGRFAAALRGAITDPKIRGLPPVGAADQFIDSTPALGDIRLLRATIEAALRPT
jgi:hypothetical protein